MTESVVFKKQKPKEKQNAECGPVLAPSDRLATQHSLVTSPDGMPSVTILLGENAQSTYWLAVRLISSYQLV